MTTNLHALDLTGRSLDADTARLQAAGPAVRVELPGGVIAWSVTRYETLKQLASDSRVSRDAQQHWPGLDSVPEGWPLAPFLIAPTVLNAYGADHSRLRGIMEPAFAAGRTVVLATNLESRLPQLLAALGEPGSGQEFDVRADYAEVIAVQTLCDLFGVPREQWGQGKQAMLDLLRPSEDPAAAAAQLAAAMEFLSNLLVSKRNAPPDDMAALLAHHDGLSDEERVLALAVTIAGGVPATTDLITNAVVNLLENPEQLAARLEGAVSWSAVIDETLRADAPVQHMPLRYAVADIDLGEGTVIRQGEPILMGFGAGGRDALRHGESAGAFDIRRLDKAHVAFGYGVHFCIGAWLGRVVATAAIRALFEHHPKLELAAPDVPLEPLPTFIFKGHATALVRL